MFEALDAVVLARVQFAFTMTFHIVFPSFTIGLASYLAVLEALWLWTGRAVFLDLFKYWLKIFSIAFGMGVVSGVVMAYQFGTNWSVFSDKTGAILGPLMAYEVHDRVLPGGRLPRRHAVRHAACRQGLAFLRDADGRGRHADLGVLDPVGEFLDADAGRLLRQRRRTIPARRAGGRSSSIPSFPYRLVHMVLAAYLTTALVVGAVGAFHLLRDNRNEGARVMFSMAMWMATLVAPIQIFAGDQHGLNTLEHQPVKVMAMEGHFRSHPHGAPLILFGLPDQAKGEMRYSIEIPKASSLILKHSLDAPLTRAGHGAARRTGRKSASCSLRSGSWWGLGFLMLAAWAVQPAAALARHLL